MTVGPPTPPEQPAGAPRPASGAGEHNSSEGWAPAGPRSGGDATAAASGSRNRGRTNRLDRGPFSRIVLGTIFLSVVAAAFWALRGDGPATAVLVAKDDLPAFHKLTSADLTMGTRRTRDPKHYAKLPVDGRITLRAVKKGAPLVQDAVGPDAKSALGADVVVVGVNVTKAATLGGAVRPGDRVQLLLSESGRRTAALDAIVMSVVPASGEKDWSLVVAVKADEGRRYGPALTSSEITVLRDPSAPRR